MTEIECYNLAITLRKTSYISARSLVFSSKSVQKEREREREREREGGREGGAFFQRDPPNACFPPIIPSDTTHMRNCVYVMQPQGAYD